MDLRLLLPIAMIMIIVLFLKRRGPSYKLGESFSLFIRIVKNKPVLLIIPGVVLLVQIFAEITGFILQYIHGYGYWLGGTVNLSVDIARVFSTLVYSAADIGLVFLWGLSGFAWIICSIVFLFYIPKGILTSDLFYDKEKSFIKQAALFAAIMVAVALAMMLILALKSFSDSGMLERAYLGFGIAAIIPCTLFISCMQIIFLRTKLAMHGGERAPANMPLLFALNFAGVLLTTNNQYLEQVVGIFVPLTPDVRIVTSVLRIVIILFVIIAGYLVARLDLSIHEGIQRTFDYVRQNRGSLLFFLSLCGLMFFGPRLGIDIVSNNRDALSPLVFMIIGPIRIINMCISFFIMTTIIRDIETYITQDAKSNVVENADNQGL